MTDKTTPSSRETAAEGEVRISFTVPSWVVEGRTMTAEAFACWVRVAAAQYLYGRSEVSLGTAAALAGMSYAEFMRVLKDAKQDTFVVDFDDLDHELAEVAKRRAGDAARG